MHLLLKATLQTPSLFIANLALQSLVLLFVTACSAPTSSPTSLTHQPTISVQPTAETGIHTTLPEVQGRLEALWRQLVASKDFAWQAAYTPLFASEWPPTPQTVWIRYAFAYGNDLSQPALVDAQRVARPWARVEYHAKGTAITLIPLSASLEAFGNQGVRPLRTDESATLARSQAVFDFCLQLDSPPTLSDSRVEEVRAYYRTWSALNGTILSVIKLEYSPFMAWLALP